MTIPNYISLGRLAVAWIILLANFVDHSTVAVQVLFLAGVLSDKLDGLIARRTKTVTHLGADIIEPLADSTLIWAGLLYALRFTDLPYYIVWYGIVLIGLGFLAVIVARLAKKAWFTGPFLRNKAPVGLAFLLIIIYLFQVPGRSVALWIGAVLGAVALFDLFWVLWGWKPKRKKRSRKRQQKKR